MRDAPHTYSEHERFGAFNFLGFVLHLFCQFHFLLVLGEDLGIGGVVEVEMEGIEALSDLVSVGEHFGEGFVSDLVCVSRCS